MVETERLRARAKAEKPTPSNAKDDGSGVAVAGVSENWFVMLNRPPTYVSVTVRLGVGAKAMLAVGEDSEAERVLPFERVSVTWNVTPALSKTTASDASVIGSLAGAVIVNRIVVGIAVAP